MLQTLFLAIALQLSIYLLFRRLGRSLKKPRVWTAVAVMLMTIPMCGALYEVFDSARPSVPLSEFAPLLASFLAAVASLCLVPVALLVGRAREGQNEDVTRITASLESEIAQRKRAEEQLRMLSFTDELTGLFNRRGLLTMGEQQLKIARRTRRRLLVIYADLDNMKRINDKFGHVEGDAALIEAAGVLREVFRESDIIARIGGDEFVILAVDSDGAPPDALINRIHQRCILANLRRAHPYVLAMSAGSAEFHPDEPVSLEELIHKADHVMYAQKQSRQKKPTRKELPKQAELEFAYGSRKVAS